METVFEPIRPVPPMTTIFMVYPPLCSSVAIPSIVPGGASDHLATDLHAKRIILDLDEGHDRLAKLAALRAVQRDNGCFAY
jgi:hypothetical protein